MYRKEKFLTFFKKKSLLTPYFTLHTPHFTLLTPRNSLHETQITPSSFPTLTKAAMHLSSCSRVWPAEICTRMRAWSFGTTG